VTIRVSAEMKACETCGGIIAADLADRHRQWHHDMTSHVRRLYELVGSLLDAGIALARDVSSRRGAE
jgi:hypothetical protein